MASLLWLAACGGGGPAAEHIAQPVPAPQGGQVFDAVPLDGQGKTAELRVPWPSDWLGVVLEAASPGGRCFQIDDMRDDADHRYIGPAESGAYCTGCEQRVSAAAGAGLYVLPSRAGPFQPSGALRFRLGLRDCATLTPAAPLSVAETLSVRVRGVQRVPPQGAVALRLRVTPASSFHDPATDAALQAVLAALNAELAPAQISARWAEVTRLPPGSASDATFSMADTGALQSLLLAGAATSASNAIPVVLAGCLRLAEPVLNRTSEPQGYTPRVPGGAGPADGIFIQGSLCGTPGPVRVEWAASALARVIAHELGHYLGLYHSAEADGSTDQLPDTDGANLMFHRPGQSGATGLSAMQGAVMRAHPAVTPVN